MRTIIPRILIFYLVSLPRGDVELDHLQLEHPMQPEHVGHGGPVENGCALGAREHEFVLRELDRRESVRVLAMQMLQRVEHDPQLVHLLDPLLDLGRHALREFRAKYGKF